ncbi:TauD/TfdA dioxygenase family protein [Candidatus Marimicrobium litorale]|uniref:TauD/TfdA family dioxygenase n=1 Tax=Candidatus Marimicrobium litorale TaxID=2518991 RepID=A0ABT3T6G9_9GAMM|nr:TauD/TfdA family dioxygenase [Candidatus Marimicrobium litorale]MCX2977416.1 TauD/TfdA family dioxygenase [Candidatus Marimicrobium litorale]
MNIQPFSPGCGATVSDIALSHVDAAAAAALRAALFEHGVLFFRDQVISEAQHIALAEALGDIVLNKFFTPVEGHPRIATVLKEADQTMNIGGGWHTDHSYEAAPALGSILVARELPSHGGNTQFAHLGRVCADLSPRFWDILNGLKAVHSNEHLYGEGGYYRDTDQSKNLGGMDVVGSAVHPMIISHPVTGQPVLYVNPGHTIGIEALDHGEAFAILNYLYEFASQPAYTCSFDWQPGSVAIWDNRLTWHQADNDYAGQRRLMHRITLAGEAISA